MITVGMNVTLGEAFVILRRRRGYAVQEVSDQSGVPVSVIENIEVDDEETVTLNDTIAIASIYNLFVQVGFTPQGPRLLGMEKREADEEADGE